VGGGQLGDHGQADARAGADFGPAPRQNRSKACGRSPSGMPGPVSATVSRAVPSPARVVKVTCPPGGVYLTALVSRLTAI
jgi:hypothetical protein